jgi:type II secretory pathway pseudopilin PulG
LLEILLALIVLSLASVALITAFQSSIKASAEHRNLANFNTALASSISNTTSVIGQQTPGVFSNCDPLSDYPSSAQLTAALGLNGYTAAIAASGSQPAVEFSSDGSYTTSCTPSDVANPQLINVVVTNTATGITQSNTVIVDNPTVIQTTGAEGSTANELVFITQPEGATVGNNFATQPVLEVEDNGVIVTSDLSPITLTVDSGPAGATLSKTCSGEETAGIVTYSGCSLNVVGTGYTLFASEPDPSGPGNLTSISAPFSVYPSQLVTPTVTTVLSSTTTVGVIYVSFTGASNAPNGQIYSVKACQDKAMSVNCVVQNNFVSGGAVTGLAAGMNYYVSITAAPSTDFLGSTSPPVGPTLATEQLPAPSVPTLGFGPASGTLAVTFAGSVGAPSGETYTVLACTNSAMSSGCVTSNSNVPTGGGTITGLTPGTLYYVVVTANATPGYLVSPPSTVAPAVPPSFTATNQVKAPVISNSTAPSPSQAGAILVTFSEPSGGAPVSSYTQNVCTDAAMTQNCVMSTVTLPGGQVGNLTPGTNYYLTITANSSTSGIASATSAVYGPVVATVQLTTPTNVTVGYGVTAGSVSVTAGTSNGPSNQTYTAKGCTNALMTLGCTTNATYTLGTDFVVATNPATGAAGVVYYVQLTANASPGYLASTTSTQASHADTGIIGVAANFTVTPGRGSIQITFTAPTGSAPPPSSYTAEVCTNSNFTGCVTQTNFTSGGQFTGLARHTTYYVELISVAPVGYVDSADKNGGTTTN